MTSGTTDSELIARSRADPVAFAEIFDRHHGELYRYLRRHAGPALAADLAAETFLAAFAGRGRYRPDGDSARPWLFGIAHNVLRNQSRAERRQRRAYARHGAIPDTDQTASEAFLRADARTDAAGISAALAQILARLPPRDRDVLLLFAWADLSYSEIACALQIPVGTVRSRLNRARRQFRGLTSSENAHYLTGELHG